MDRLQHSTCSTWSAAGTVAGFAQSPPNATLMQYAECARRQGFARALDIGCGAGRNAVPLARMGWCVLGVDLSWPMLCAAAERLHADGVAGRLALAVAPMDRLPARMSSVDLIVAHGIWNLAKSATEFRTGVREAARVARLGARLFVFTFSRNSLPLNVRPVRGEPFVFTQFSGQRQCFLTAEQLVQELAAAGFAPDPAVPLTEHNKPRPGTLRTEGPPVIYEGAFLYRA